MRSTAVALLSLICLWLPAPGSAHALDPAYLDIAALGQDRWRVTWRRPDVAGRPMPIAARLPAGCRNAAPRAAAFDGRGWTSAWVTTCPDGLEGGRITIQGLERTATDTLLRYELQPGDVRIHRLTAAEPAFTMPREAGRLALLSSYGGLGVVHILQGVDHLLFVLALMLLIPDPRRLLLAITAFTLAHSVTLAAALLGVLALPPPPVEAVIALSIVFLAWELTRPPGRRVDLATRSPWIVAFAFGLVHGLGFAGALQEIGLPKGDIPLALLSFNAGVEAGQIAFVAVVLATGAAARRLYPILTGWGRPTRRAAGYAIGSLAAFWVIERVAAF